MSGVRVSAMMQKQEAYQLLGALYTNLASVAVSAASQVETLPRGSAAQIWAQKFIALTKLV